MESKYIVRRPIKDINSRIAGYEILYHGENQAYGSAEADSRSNEFAAADTIYSFLTQNVERSLRGTRNFMTFTTTLLMKRVPHLFAPEDLVIQIDDSVIIHPLALHFVQQYAREGYQIAINEFQFAPRYLALIDQFDYIKLNMQSMSVEKLQNVVEIAHSMKKIVIATYVDSETLYQAALSLGVDGLEGDAVAEKLATKAHSSNYLQSNFFRLLVAVTREEPNMEEIEEIISMDATLSYGLMKLANTARFSVRRQVSNVRQAIVTLGITQLKQWIYLLSASSSQNQLDTSAEEFLKLSFVRANFCSELMNYTRAVPISKGEAYLMGMFSTLNFLIDAPMEEILAEISIAEEIKNALIAHEGPCGALYDLMLSYERADWQTVNALASALGVPPNVLTGLYFSCTESADTIWKEVVGTVGG